MERSINPAPARHLSRNRRQPHGIAPAARPGAARIQRPPARRIALFGLFGVGNFGNDGSLEVMLDFLRRVRPEAEIICVCGNPQAVTDSFGVDALPLRGTPPSDALRRWRRGPLKLPAKLRGLAAGYRELRRADALVIPGTGILDDFGDGPGGMPLHILLWCLMARAARVPVCFVSIGAGPIRHRISRRLMVAAAGLARYRSYRDEVSRAFLAGAGIDTRADRVRPDLVFRMPAPRDVRAPSPEDRLVVGVGVMGYEGWSARARGSGEIHATYLEKIVRFVRHLLTEGHAVRLLTGDVGDEETVREVLDRTGAGPDAGPQARTMGSLHDLMAQIAETDIVVATRYHNIVCALKMCRPTISLGYAAKNDVLMTEMGFGEFCHHVEHFDVDVVARQFARLAAAHGHFRDRLADACRRAAEDLEAQERELLALYL